MNYHFTHLLLEKTYQERFGFEIQVTPEFYKPEEEIQVPEYEYVKVKLNGYFLYELPFHSSA